MEHRVTLTNEEAFELMEKLKIVRTWFVKDEYTGTKQLRTDETGVREKEYLTPVVGVIYRFSALCELGNVKNVWFEHKWTKDRQRFEVEFEGKVPKEYKSRKNIRGWEILK